MGQNLGQWPQLWSLSTTRPNRVPSPKMAKEQQPLRAGPGVGGTCNLCLPWTWALDTWAWQAGEEQFGAGCLKTGLACPGDWQAASEELGEAAATKQDPLEADQEGMISSRGWREPREGKPGRT